MKVAFRAAKGRLGMETEKRSFGSCVLSGLLVILALALLLQLVFYLLERSEYSKLQARLEALKAEGMPTKYTDLALPPQPAETNGATYYLEADAALSFQNDEKDLLANAPRLVLEGKLDAKQLAQVQAILSRNSKALTLIAKGNEQPRTVFHVDWEKGTGATFGHWAKVRELARVQAAQTVVLAASGQGDAAMESFIAGMRLAATSQDDWTLIGQLVRIAMEAIALNSLEASLKVSRPSVAALKRAYDMLGKTDELQSLVRALEGERAFGLGVFEDLRSGKYSFGQLMGVSDEGQSSTTAVRWLILRGVGPGRWLSPRMRTTTWTRWLDRLSRLGSMSRTPPKPLSWLRWSRTPPRGTRC